MVFRDVFSAILSNLIYRVFFFSEGRLDVKMTDLFGLIFFALLKRGCYIGALQLIETEYVSMHLLYFVVLVNVLILVSVQRLP